MSLTILDKMNLALQRVKKNNADKKRWMGSAVFDSPRVFYGYDSLPDRNDTVSGGIIKCQDLADVFPNALSDSNILYLVSSSLPVNISDLITYAKQVGVKVVLNQNGVAYKAWHGSGWETTNEGLKGVLNSADHVIYQSEFCKNAADEFLNECSTSCQVLHNPVDLTRFKPRTYSGDRSCRLLVAGSHHHAYRVSTVLEAMTKVDSAVTLTVAGPLCWKRNRSEAETEAFQKVIELGIQDRVTFVGPYSQTSAPDIFSSADVLVHLQYNDNCPRLVAEAMASGCGIIYSNSGGTPELVGPDAGIPLDVPYSWEETHTPSADHIAEAITTIQENLVQVSAAARSRAESNLDVEDWLTEHKTLFDGWMS